MGIDKYTIVDLPTVSATQYLILAGSLGVDAVSFGDAPIKLVPAHKILDINWEVDCVVNVDSLPEMPSSASRKYVELAGAARVLFSINQESQMKNGEERQMTVSELCKTGYSRQARFPYWMRTGWVEEIYHSDRAGRATAGNSKLTR